MVTDVFLPDIACTSARFPLQLTSLKQEREGTELLVSEMGGKQAQLTAWLDRNEPKAAAWQAAVQAAQGGPDGQLDWDSILPAADDVSKQALEAQVWVSVRYTSMYILRRIPVYC